ncbi:hypothetical protein [Nonlabens agnitus]|uniref:Uncharacterized protein n=1 Tax=Nonlabens agnitus TaxID=870484 RepID=A0A2S9WXA9_9FLAO|nr:hypothetical protein [Nonlabens agnitus]PRP68095.1 hypothetical protein BST86_13865 [Nonlabens agnitus]
MRIMSILTGVVSSIFINKILSWLDGLSSTGGFTYDISMLDRTSTNVSMEFIIKNDTGDIAHIQPSSIKLFGIKSLQQDPELLGQKDLLFDKILLKPNESHLFTNIVLPFSIAPDMEPLFELSGVTGDKTKILKPIQSFKSLAVFDERNAQIYKSINHE